MLIVIGQLFILFSNILLLVSQCLYCKCHIINTQVKIVMQYNNLKRIFSFYCHKQDFNALAGLFVNINKTYKYIEGGVQ